MDRRRENGLQLRIPCEVQSNWRTFPATLLDLSEGDLSSAPRTRARARGVILGVPETSAPEFSCRVDAARAKDREFLHPNSLFVG
jgi:hypothetical protein